MPNGANATQHGGLTILKTASKFAVQFSGAVMKFVKRWWNRRIRARFVRALDEVAYNTIRQHRIIIFAMTPVWAQHLAYRSIAELERAIAKAKVDALAEWDERHET